MRNVLLSLGAFGLLLNSPADGAPPTTMSARQINQIVEIVLAESPQPIAISGDVSVGMKLPDATAVTPLPTRVIRIVPAFENHAFILLSDGRIAIIEPFDLIVVSIF